MMGFGRRVLISDDGDAATDASAVSLLPWVAAAALGIVAMAAGYFLLRTPREVDHAALLEQAALAQGVTGEVRGRLRLDLTKALIEMDRDLCEESTREKAGKQAVRYYETLLEKPVTAAGLEMSYHFRCQRKLAAGSHPFELLIAAGGLGSNLQLPWDCLPDHWRTPTDRALQAKLEHVLRAGYLTNDSLTGTLALVARSSKLSSIPGLCHRPSSNLDRRPNLPLVSEPLDDWDRRGRRRRY